MTDPDDSGDSEIILNAYFKEAFDDEKIAMDIHTAASVGFCDIVAEIVTNSHDPDACNLAGWTGLMYASCMDCLNVVEYLLRAGCSVDKQSIDGLSSLMLAASRGFQKVVSTLIKYGANIELNDDRGRTALYHAVTSGQNSMVQFLINSGANLNTIEPINGMTPLMEAASSGHEMIVHNLLANGVNANLKSKSGLLAWQIALANGNTKIVSDIHSHCSTAQPSVRDGPAAISQRMKDSRKKYMDHMHNMREVIHGKTGEMLTVALTPCKASDISCGNVLSGFSNVAIKDKLLTADDQNPSIKRQSSSPKLLTVEQENIINREHSDLAGVLQTIGCAKYAGSFKDNDVNSVEVFLELTDSDLKEIGIKLLGPRRKMTMFIAKMRKEDPGYIARLEDQAEEMAQWISQATLQLDRMQSKIDEEHELRRVAETCLTEDRARLSSVVSKTRADFRNIITLSQQLRKLFGQWKSLECEQADVTLDESSLGQKPKVDQLQLLLNKCMSVLSTTFNTMLQVTE